MNSIASEMTIDLRKIPPQDRYRLIFPTLKRLVAGEAIELVNDDDPKTLLLELQTGSQAPVGWNYLQSGPQIWRVRLTDPTGERSEGQCCSSRGGT